MIHYTVLNEREKEATKLISFGYSLKEIAAQMKLSQSRVGYLIADIKRKTLCGPTFVHVLRWAVESGLVRLEKKL